MTKVSVVINCHNSEKFIKQALTSALNQTYEDIEIICYNNFSTDNTKKLFSLSEMKEYNIFIQINFLHLEKLEIMQLKNAKGEFIAFLDSDDIWKKDKLEKIR